MKVAKYSRRDSKGLLFVSCAECARGGNGEDKEKCSCGWKEKSGKSGRGCFAGRLMEGLEEKAELALKFLKTKIREYQKVREQIRELAKEVGHEKVPADLEGEGQEAA